MKKYYNFFIRLPAVLIAAFIWFLSSQSILPKPKGVLGFDKAQHLLAFAVLTGAICLWVSREKWKTRGFLFMLIAASIGSAYGVIDEVHQYFVPGRDCNVWDWLADALGAVIGAGAGAFAGRRILKEQDTV